MERIKGAENYSVYGFMTRGLGLSGAELQVYAVIYSFSRDGIGTFSGSREYLAATVGFSVATVDRAIKKLLERGIIKRTKVYRTHREYVAVIPSGALGNTRQNDENGSNQNDWRESSNCGVRVIKMTTNNKEDNKEITNTTSSSSTKSARREGGHAHTRESEKKEFSEDGGREEETKKNESCAPLSEEEEEDDFIILKCIECAAFDHYVTYEQYNHLCDMIGERAVLDYFGRLDGYMYKHRNARPHSAYRTILKWIKEDFAVNGK